MGERALNAVKTAPDKVVSTLDVTGAAEDGCELEERLGVMRRCVREKKKEAVHVPALTHSSVLSTQPGVLF
jgi:hypothetical protein